MKKLRVLVKPSANDTSVMESLEYDLLVHVTERPESGKANIAVIEAVSGYLKVPKSLVIIKSGHRAKIKTIVVDISDLK